MATMPRTIAPIGPANPAAGVTATRPVTAPDTAPSIDALPRAIDSMTTHVNAAAAVAMKVLIIASTA